MVIDFHTHVFPAEVKKNRRRYADQDPAFAMIYANEKAKLATADELIKSMDRDGVDISVIANYGWTTHELCVTTNDYILEAVARYPQRLVGFCSVPPRPLEAAIAEVERCARAGIRGVGELRPDIQSLDLEHKEAMQPLVEVLRKHQLILMLHTSEPVGHLYPGKGTVTPDMIYPFVANFPDLPVVCAHWGGGLPFYALMPEVRQAMENVYFDTAASPLLYTPQIYQQVSQLVGADRILLGSDYPLIAQSRLIREIDCLDLTKEEKGLILSGNARRLLGI